MAMNSQNSIVKIVLTGGPCGGKTTASSVITDRLQDLGWRVFRVPEAATILLSGGMSFYDMSENQAYNFQVSLLKLMLSLEDAFESIARNCGQKAVILCDRGAMDCSAYMDKPSWDRMMNELNLSTVNLRDQRYNCVLHLVTAADGAEQFYNNETNITRTETAKHAREIDERIRQSWVGHPYFHVVDNREGRDFSGKINALLKMIMKHIGETSPGLIKRKFLVSCFPSSFPVKHEDYDVDHDYLLSSDGTQHRLRKRGQYGVYSYTHTIRYPDILGQRIELRHMLSSREYLSIKRQRDPSRLTVKKKRRSFLWQKQYFELDYFLQPCEGLILLEAYMKTGDDITLPDFIDVQKEVTGDPSYSMYTLAIRQDSQPNEDSKFIRVHSNGLSLK